jgi:hypothetical protein
VDVVYFSVGFFFWSDFTSIISDPEDPDFFQSGTFNNPFIAADATPMA